MRELRIRPLTVNDECQVRAAQQVMGRENFIFALDPGRGSAGVIDQPVRAAWILRARQSAQARYQGERRGKTFRALTQAVLVDPVVQNHQTRQGVPRHAVVLRERRQFEACVEHCGHDLAQAVVPLHWKWLGSAFARTLHHDDDLPAHLAAAVHARDAQQREQALGSAWTALARRHNRSGLTEPVRAAIGSYHGRPARVLMADRFSAALPATVTDPELRVLPLIGAIDQAADNTDLLQAPQRHLRLAELYTANRSSR